MKLKDLTFRSWTYFRLGFSTYLAFIVGFATFVTTTYYLAIENVPFLKVIFTHFYVFVVVSVAVIIPASVLIGWFHMKRTLAYPTDVAIGVEANPYTYIIVPGKEAELYTPHHLLILNSLQRILEKEKILSPEEKKEFENIRAKWEKLIKGEAIGVPRQLQVLAILKKKEAETKAIKN